MVGDNKFNWTTVENLVQGSATRKMHAVLSVFIHWPGQPLRLPPHLRNIPLHDTDNGKSPFYGDTRLLKALEQFIKAWGVRMDGDKRFAAIHIGLLGFWGEGHTYPDTALVPEQAKHTVAGWYRNSFNKTQIQARYPGLDAKGFGLYDGSFAYQTLDGKANGNVDKDWFMWPKIVKAEQQDSWKNFMMGGETRPELQDIIFTNAYPAGTEWHQSLRRCINTMHVSYLLHHDAFQNNGYQGEMLKNARAAHSYMGYSFYVSEVNAAVATLAGHVNIGVTITQYGVAPFYYDLSLILECDGAKKMQEGVHEIVEKGQQKFFLFRNIPVTENCLSDISVRLYSSFAYEGRPIVFAQGSDGKVSFSIPIPMFETVSRSTPVSPPRPAPRAVFPLATPVRE